MYKVFSSLSVQESPTHNVCHSFKICSVAYPPSSQLGGHVCLCNCISQTSFFPALLTIVVVTSRGVGSDVCLGHFGTFRDKFWDMRLLYFWDILGHFGTSAKQKSSESGPETTPEGHRSKQTDQPNPVRSCDVWPFQNILGHILGHVGTFRDIR